MIAFWGKKNLSFIFQSSEGLAMQNSISVNLEDGTNATRFLRSFPTEGFRAKASQGG
jgi:hypothetical protein